MDLITTRRKQKLPKGFSYPIGAEVLSAALMSVPQYDDIELRFEWRDEYWASKYQEILKSKGVIGVLTVRYSPTKYSTTPEKWWIVIASVPSGHNSKVKSLLQDGILDHLKKALLTSDELTSYFLWQAKYDLSGETIAIEGTV